MKKTKALVFDCDGTLIDTIKDYVAAVNYALSAVDLPGITDDEGRAFLGFGSGHLVKAALQMRGHEELFDQIYGLYFNYYVENVYVRSQKYPGIDAMLADADQRGYQIIIASNKPAKALTRLLKLAFPTFEFAGVYGQKPDFAPKPDPQLLAQIMQDLNLTPDQIAYFGDTEVDDQFAANANIKQRYLLTYGFRSAASLKKNTQPRQFLNSVAEIAEVIKKLP